MQVLIHIPFSFLQKDAALSFWNLESEFYFKKYQKIFAGESRGR